MGSQIIKAYRGLVWFIFMVYLFLLGYQLFFVAYGSYDRHAQEEVAWNVVPFSTLYNYIRNAEHYGFTIWFINVFGNVAAFIPFGFFVGLLFKICRDRKWLTLSLTAAFSLMIECLQVSFRVGNFDVDDILLNSLGGMIGWGVVRALRPYS
jgi:glycopeptide antibiotics resistance protein